MNDFLPPGYTQQELDPPERKQTSFTYKKKKDVPRRRNGWTDEEYYADLKKEQEKRDAFNEAQLQKLERGEL